MLSGHWTYAASVSFRFTLRAARFTLRAAHPALLLLLHVQLRPLLLVWCSAFSSLKLFVLVFFGRGAGSSLLQCVLVFFRALCSTLLVLFHYSLLCCALSSSLTCLSLCSFYSVGVVHFHLLWWVLLVYSVRSTLLCYCSLSLPSSLFFYRGSISHRVSISHRWSPIDCGHGVTHRSMWVPIDCGHCPFYVLSTYSFGVVPFYMYSFVAVRSFVLFCCWLLLCALCCCCCALFVAVRSLLLCALCCCAL